MMHRRSFLTALAGGIFAPRSAWTARRGRTAPAPADRNRVAARQTGGTHALVLGSVQDGGFPQVGCYTDRCEEGRALHAAGRGRYVSSLALVEPRSERFYLVDATPDITRQVDLITDPVFRRRAAERTPFDGIFLTHAHIGHYAGLAQLGHEGLGIRDTPVFCTDSMAEFLSSDQPWRLLVEQGRIELRPLVAGRWHRIDEQLAVQLWKVPHRDEIAETVAFVFRGSEASLLYLPDIDAWDRWDRDLAEAVSGVDVAVLDGTFWSTDEVPGRSMRDIPHPLITRTMEALQRVVDRGACRVVFTHLNNTNPALDDDGPQRAEIARRGFEVAREGMRFGL